MNINLHHTNRIEMSQVLPVNDVFYRIITITTNKGESIEMTLFGKTREELEVTL
jgi:hypothetical protein